jgi:xylulokinase
MMKGYLIGVDIGTQGTKTALLTTDGNVVAESFEASRLISPSPGIVEQDPDEIYFSVINTICEVIQKSGVSPEQVLAIGLDGQMAGIMGIDEDWNAVTHYDSWLDNRCEKYINLIKQEAEEKVIQITGCPVTYAHGSKMLWWKNERPDIYKKIKKFILPTTYVAGRLTGLKASQAYIDYTHLHFSGFGDVCRKKWSDELISHFNMDKEKLPEIVEPWKIIGCLTEESADMCSLISGVPVVAGCGDQAATSLGAGVTRKGIIFDVAGTASVFSCCVDRFKPDISNKTLVYARSVIPGLWTPLAYINGGGLCLKWFRDNLTGKGKTASYDELEKEAWNIKPGCEGLIFIPHFGGRVCPNNPYVRGSWIGLNWVHERGHMYRAILEGIAYEYKYYLGVLKGLVSDISFSEVRAIGGGAKSRLFNSIKADVLGIPYVPLKRGDTATLGSAVVAGFGIGIYDNMESVIDKIVERQDMINPNPDNHSKYGRYAQIYMDILATFENTFKQLQGKE